MENQGHTDVGEYVSIIKLYDCEHYRFYGSYAETYEYSWKITPFKMSLKESSISANIVYPDDYTEIDMFSVFENPSWSTDGSWKNLIQSATQISILSSSFDFGLGGGPVSRDYNYEVENGKVVFTSYSSALTKTYTVKLAGNLISDEFTLTVNKVNRVYKVTVPTQTDYDYGNNKTTKD